MGMTIDDAIKRIDNIMFTKFTTVKDEDAFLTAIDTMRKYQRIRQIYMTHHYTDEEVIEKIKDVIKLG